MAAYELGYADERFEVAVSRRFHCTICLNVFKDPVMCRQNQHLFCRDCITRHLLNFQRCPVCMDELSLDTLSVAPRILTDYLAELRIRCEFFGRGCLQFIKLDDLERHVDDCGFAPAVCSNEGCQLEVNKSELIHHETAVCERRVICHNCEQLSQEVGELRTNLTAMNNKLDEMEKASATAITCLESSQRHGVDNILVEVGEKLDDLEKNLSAKVDDKLDSLCVNRLEALECRLQEHNKEIKTRLTAMSGSLAKLPRLELKSGRTSNEELIPATNSQKTKETMNVIIAGGLNNGKTLSTVEKFNLSTRVWVEVKPMVEGIYQTSSVHYCNQMIILGGQTSSGVSDDMVRLNTGIKSASWNRLAVPLPIKLWGHCSVVHNNNLFILGGCIQNGSISSEIHVIQLLPPYTSALLARLPDVMMHHSVQLFEDQIVIVGSLHNSWSYRSRLCNVFLYDITKNECKQLAPVPFAAVSDMATVRWGDHIIIIGGVDSHNKALKTVVMYNIRTQLSDVLPCMNYARRGCVAAVLGTSIVAIGGAADALQSLNTVECFDFQRFSWEELPSMHEARYSATGVAF